MTTANVREAGTSTAPTEHGRTLPRTPALSALSDGASGDCRLLFSPEKYSNIPAIVAPFRGRGQSVSPVVPQGRLLRCPGVQPLSWSDKHARGFGELDESPRARCPRKVPRARCQALDYVSAYVYPLAGLAHAVASIVEGCQQATAGAGGVVPEFSWSLAGTSSGGSRDRR